MGVIIVPTQLAVVRAREAFDAQGNLLDERQRETVRAIGAEVVSFAIKLG
jgi:hypothetical protein